MFDASCTCDRSFQYRRNVRDHERSCSKPVGGRGAALDERLRLFLAESPDLSRLTEHAGRGPRLPHVLKAQASRGSCAGRRAMSLWRNSGGGLRPGRDGCPGPGGRLHGGGLAGAAVGAPMRFLVDWAVQRRQPTEFPWGTFTANVFGCLIWKGSPREILHCPPQHAPCRPPVAVKSASLPWHE